MVYDSSFGLLGLLILVLDIMALASLWGGSSPTERKLLWTVAIVLLPFLGMLLYYAFGRSSRDMSLKNP